MCIVDYLILDSLPLNSSYGRQCPTLIIPHLIDDYAIIDLDLVVFVKY